jgi:hypothetical protein
VRAHQQLNGLKSTDDLRDHETVFELLLSVIGEETARELHRLRGSRGRAALGRDARDVGAVASATRRAIEPLLGYSVVSPANATTLRQGRQHELQLVLLDGLVDGAPVDE